MFFEFISIVITNIFIISGFVITEVKDVYLKDDNIVSNESLSKELRNNEAKILQNRMLNIRDSNLKANVFDKMLSDEMLSIKQHIHNKDYNPISPITISSKIIVPTPTLEIKQHWPIEKLLTSKAHIDPEVLKQTKNDINEKNKFATTPDVLIENEIRYNPKSTTYSISHVKNKLNKVVGVRSFSSNTVHNHPSTKHCQHFSPKSCFCMKSNPDTTCSLHCSASVKDTKICSHTESHSTSCSRCLLCTRTTMLPYSVYPYYVSQPYVYVEVSDQPTYLYLPYTQKPEIYDSSEEEDEEEDMYYDMKTTTTHRRGESDEKQEKDKLINDVFHDLKVHYGDVFIKDCYCRSCSTFLAVHINIIPIAMGFLIRIIIQ